MSLLTAVLLLWDSNSEAILWADPQSLLEPWANLTLTCKASFPTKDFQLIMNGWRVHHVHLDDFVTSHQFPLGAITSNNTGLYRCRIGLEPLTNQPTEERWTELSNLVEVTGTEPLPRPSLSAYPVPWIVVPYLGTYVRCHSALRGVTLQLRMEGHELRKETKAQDKEQAWFIVYKAGNYSCSYRTHAEGNFSEPSATLTIKSYNTPPPPILYYFGNYPKIKFKSRYETLTCRAPLDVLEFQLRRGEKVLNVSSFSPIQEAAIFFLNLTELEDPGPFTCRYLLHRELELELEIWSEDSKPIELMWSDGTLPAPVLTVEPSSKNIEPGSTVHLRCTAPKAGLRFGLQREGNRENSLIQMLKPAGSEAVFVLHNVSTIDSGNYSCAYMEQAAPFSGSPPSETLELHVNGPPPRPKLEALWTGKVPVGRDANFRCHGHVPQIDMELVREGDRLPTLIGYARRSTSADLKLAFVGPQHTGNYTCRYMAAPPLEFESGISDPVEVIVEGV
ncbi:alpha-1B-glycoprotein [Phodopus roborovskii]|uniref:alpha-1B-glycoprotein n=1 Tax=Phodopus roborovskii TaxID=109678 RepID=UPI0021E3B82F|nr:alpha-1B-glycoprotein [Phodopus roborovskii]